MHEICGSLSCFIREIKRGPVYRKSVLVCGSCVDRIRYRSCLSFLHDKPIFHHSFPLLCVGIQTQRK